MQQLYTRDAQQCVIAAVFQDADISQRHLFSGWHVPEARRVINDPVVRILHSFGCNPGCLCRNQVADFERSFPIVSHQQVADGGFASRVCTHQGEMPTRHA